MPRRLSFLAALLAVEVAVAAPLDEIPAYKQGIDALSDHLWDLAARRFEEAMKTPELADKDRQTLLLRLAESRIRAGQPDSADLALSHELLKEHPAQPFWKAQSLLARGRLGEALEILKKLPDSGPHPIEALLTQARVQRAIGDREGALATLDRLIRLPKAPDSARILRANFLFADGLPEKAIEACPDPTRLPAAQANQVRLLRARCLLALDQPDSALPLLQRLVGDPDDPLAAQNQTLRDHHQAIIDLARARLALGKRQEAADGLLPFLPKNPKSPLLDEAFSVLVSCLPEVPAPNDPILTRLREWTPPPPVPQPPLLIRPDASAAAAWPGENPLADPLAPEALFHLALTSRRLDLPDAVNTSRRLLSRLRLEFPHHPLVGPSLLELGRWELEAGRKDRATACFDAISRLGDSSPPELRAQALAMEATARFQDGDFDAAARLFDDSADLLEDDRRRDARLNAASALLAADDRSGFAKLAESAGADSELQADLALERALYLASQHSPDALADLIDFTLQHPEHPRLAEARLQAVLTALDGPQPDLEQATAQFDAISPEQRSQLNPPILALAEVRLLGHSGRWTEAASRAADFIAAFPEDPLLPLLTYERGKALFRNKDFNDAGIALKSLAQNWPDSPHAPAALFLAARAAASGATPQAKKESIELFRKLLDRQSPFRDISRIEISNLLISLAELDEAIAILDPWFKEMRADDALLAHVGLLLGDALYARAEGDGKLLQRVIDVQDRLLKTLPPDSPFRARILYKKGRALEGFKTTAAEDEALMAYLDVVQAAAGKTKADWESIELCGFAALQIYGNREEWLTAKKLAERIASLNGPRAADAAKRAKAIGQEQMLWDEESELPEAPPEPESSSD
ncbi:MAG: tetratricopeptide repeat protein [Akkermansiaceae bacterium]|jgi:outer membrane protein assembly factor BamD (BamD/ComL family)|nr:tetratricopeptide repeat protein [Akkermansiaceae bacterium]